VDQVITTLRTSAQVELLESSDLLTRYRVSHVLQIPESVEGVPENTRRTSKQVDLPIVSTLTLRKGQRWIDVHTTTDNQAENHRLRACFPTRLAVEKSAAESTFDVIERAIVQSKESSYYGEPNPQFPMHRFVDLSDGKLGLAILNEGLREYEALVDDDRTVAITLVRGFPAQQSPVIDQWDVYPWMKLAQSLGRNECHYAIMPHAGEWHDAGLYREADRFVLPLETAQAGKGGGAMPKQLSFVEVGPEEIALSALKKCDERDSMVLRLFNPTDVAVKGSVTCHHAIKEAWLTNMNEQRRKQLTADGNSVSVPFAHKQIITLELVF
jgi:mannosylglycerate hydrolase